MNRKDFFKKACISGACLCGFAPVALSTVRNDESTSDASQNNSTLKQEWISELLSNLNGKFKREEIKGIIKNCSITHYNDLKMDEMLKEFKGDLNKFIGFIEEKWGWEIQYDKSSNTLIADENKNHCVCPILNHDKKQASDLICYCSEGFAEKMFSVVAGTGVVATVISSIHRGDKSCKYKIVFS